MARNFARGQPRAISSPKLFDIGHLLTVAELLTRTNDDIVGFAFGDARLRRDRRQFTVSFERFIGGCGLS